MNENLIKRIIQYLELETNYAIIINGNYGIGKTHYIKNELFPLVKEKSIPNCEKQEKYIPIHISLFGVKSIDDIQNQIFIELYPILKKKGLKIAIGLGKTVFKYLSGSDFNDLLGDIDTSSRNFIDYNKILLCIDDIDRKSANIDIVEVFGFINNLVENFNAKIIIITNEDVLRENAQSDKDNYSNLKEKVIGISINFNTNVPLIYDEIIKQKYKSTDKSYFDFLTKNKALIVKRIEQNKDNLRNLLFFFEHFKIVHKNLLAYFSTEKKFDILKDDIIYYVLDFALPIAIEYKMGKLNSTNFEEIQAIYRNSFIDIYNYLKEKDVKKVPKLYSDIYREMYISNNLQKRFYFDSVFNYITGISSLNIEELAIELNSIYKFEDNTISERDQILSKLNYWGCIDLKSNEYRSLTIKLLKFVDQGEFVLEQYPTVFHYVTRFSNILNFNVDKLIKRFKRGINKGKKNYKYHVFLHMKLSVEKTAEFYDDLTEVVNYCIKINNCIKEETESKKILDIFEMFSKEFDTFLEKVQEYNNEFSLTPFFTKFNFNKTWGKIKTLQNTQIINLAFYISDRYKVNIYEDLYPEKDFLLALNDVIEKELAKKSKTKMEKVALEIFKSKVLVSINNFPK